MNLSDKIDIDNMAYPIIDAKDVREFIKKLKKGYAKGDPFLKRINKLAGEKLV